MKPKTKLAFQLQSDEIRNTHLVMSNNGKHVALVMRDTLVIAHDISQSSGNNTWVVIHVKPTEYSVFVTNDISSPLVKMNHYNNVITTQQKTEFDGVVMDAAISDLGTLTLLQCTNDYKGLITYTTKDLKSALAGHCPYLERIVTISLDTWDINSIYYRPYSNNLYVVGSGSLLIDFDKGTVIENGVFGYLAINPKGERTIIKYDNSAYRYLSAYGKYVGEIIVPPYDNYNHVSINIKPTKSQYVKTSMVVKRPTKSEYWLPSVAVSDSGKVFWVCNEHSVKSRSCRYTVMLSMHLASSGYIEYSDMLYYMDVRRLMTGNSFQISHTGKRIAYVNTTNKLTVVDMVE